MQTITYSEISEQYKEILKKILERRGMKDCVNCAKLSLNFRIEEGRFKCEDDWECLKIK